MSRSRTARLAARTLVATLTTTAQWPGMRTFSAIYGGSAPYSKLKACNPPTALALTTDWDFADSKYSGSIAPARARVVLPSSVLGVPVPQANRSTLSSRRATSRQRTGRGVAHAAPALIARSAAAMRSRMWANVGASPMNMGLILAKSVRSS